MIMRTFRRIGPKSRLLSTISAHDLFGLLRLTYNPSARQDQDEQAEQQPVLFRQGVPAVRSSTPSSVACLGAES